MHPLLDIIGDVHGCAAELDELLRLLGHPDDPDLPHPAGRRLVFVGDLVDRGPDTPGVIRRVRRLMEAGRGACVAGNHDLRLAEALRGLPVEPGHGLESSLAQLAHLSDGERLAIATFLDGLPGHLVLDGGRLVVAHAGLEERWQGDDSTEAREIAVHGRYTGAFDERAMPVRDDWAARYRGAAAVVQGHTPVAEPEWFNNTLCIDTGCVFGGRLTALRWPEREIVSVKSSGAWGRSARGPLPPRRLAPRPVANPAADEPSVDQPTAAGALASLRRAAAAEVGRGGGAAATVARGGPFVIHLPPTMSSCDPGPHSDELEHPLGAFAHYASEGLRRVICEEKHTGLRAVVVVCRDPDVAARRFGAGEGTVGAIHSRAGSALVAAAAERTLVDAIRTSAAEHGLWAELDTDWLCLDGELLDSVAAGGEPTVPRLTLFHLLASAGRTWFHREHAWHVATLGRLAADAGPIGVTSHRAVDLTRPTDVAAAIAWWHDLTVAGAEGIVVKPVTLAAAGVRGVVQPALKVRGVEWLRGVFGRDYRERDSLARLRRRDLTTKRARALGQFALGIESLERFVTGAPRSSVDACLAAIRAWVPATSEVP